MYIRSNRDAIVACTQLSSNTKPATKLEYMTVLGVTINASRLGATSNNANRLFPFLKERVFMRFIWGRKQYFPSVQANQISTTRKTVQKGF